MTSPSDPLLRTVLGATAGGRHGDACPVAEVLALYAEQALQREERAGVEAHVASCGRCQQVLAAFVRAAPEPGVSEATAGAAAWWRGWRWVVPMAATAGVAVLAVWVGRTPSERAAYVGPGVATPEQDAFRAAPPPSAAPAAVPAETRANEGAAAAPLAKAKEAVSTGRADRTPQEARQALRGASTDQTVAAGRLAEASSPAPAPAAAAPPPAPPAAPSATAELVAPPEAAAETLTVTPAVPDTRFRATLEAGARAEAEPARKPAEPAAEAKSEVGQAAARDERGATSPWRLQAGVVERSTDGGRSWARIALPTREAVRTLVVTDGTTATVTTTSGVRYRTTDGGVTWRRIPG